MASGDPHELLTARVRVPRDVVYRSFATEIVVLNLRTGGYHSLNRTVGRMPEALVAAPTVGVESDLIPLSGHARAQVDRDHECRLSPETSARPLRE
jgi:hypothetical protein